MKKPAAREGDIHTCPMATPTPHLGGAINSTNCTTVLIAGKPAAIVQDYCSCEGSPNVIISGSTSVLIAGKYAARLNDTTAHGGAIKTGCLSVLIGGITGIIFLGVGKVKIIEEAIRDCIAILNRKYFLLEIDDSITLRQFKKYFGMDEKEAKTIIMNRITLQLTYFKKLSGKRFDVMSVFRESEIEYSLVFPGDEPELVYVGKTYWNNINTDKDTLSTILIHEVSHFESIGKTKDYAYDNDCYELAIIRPERALHNADSYLYFIKDIL